MTRRFHAESLDADAVTLAGAEAHHALNVVRVRPGEPVELFDGRGGSAAGVVAETGRGELTVRLTDRRRLDERPGRRVHLAFAVPKGKRLDWLLEKATELAAASLQPVVFARSVAGGERLSEGKRRRWVAHCVAAAKQCGADFLPELHDPVPLADYLRDHAAADRRGVFGVCDASGEPAGEALRRLTGDEVGVLVGPEGGMTDEETAAVAEAGLRAVRLGRTTLRIETAAIALLAVATAAME